MIYVGTDIVTISRIDKLISENGKRFLERVYTKNEQNICNSKANPKIHYSGKFAAKEAFTKALGTGIRKGVNLKNIEITNNVHGKPSISLKGNCIANLRSIQDYVWACKSWKKL